MADVADGVIKGLGGEGTAAPVTTLEPLVLEDGDAEKLRDERRQAHLAHPGEPGGDVRVVEVADTKAVMPVKRPEVVVGAMQDLLDGRIVQDPALGCQLLQSDGIDQVGAPAGRDLD